MKWRIFQMADRVPHWQYLCGQISELTCSAADRAYGLDALIAAAKRVIIPERNCADVLAAIDERISALADSPFPVGESLQEMRRAVEEQVAYHATKGRAHDMWPA